MNKVLGIVVMLVPSMVFSQWSLLNESFDDYNVGELVSTVGTDNGWGLWTGLDAESCVVSTDQFLSGTNSGHVFDDGTTSTLEQPGLGQNIVKESIHFIQTFLSQKIVKEGLSVFMIH